MAQDKFERSIEELEKYACKWWPKEVREEAQKVSILQTLLDTQEKFISILKLADKKKPTKIFALLDASELSYNLFLKHLLVLTDIGAEQLQRINRDFTNIFPDRQLHYKVGSKASLYEFTELPVRGTLNNARMKVDTKEHLLQGNINNPLCKDIIMMLLYGGAAADTRTRAILYKCTPFEYLGDDNAIDTFVRQNYIRVSKIIAGKTANDLGNFAQQYALQYLENKLGEEYSLRSNGTIPGVTENDGVTLSTFDIVVHKKNDDSKHKKYVGIEVSFQETSNSVIERKGTLARNRFEKIVSRRCYVAYIIDGAGNFSRRSAVTSLCENSHCNVAYTLEEFDVLIEFIKEKLG